MHVFIYLYIHIYTHIYIQYIYTYYAYICTHKTVSRGNDDIHHYATLHPDSLDPSVGIPRVFVDFDEL